MDLDEIGNKPEEIGNYPQERILRLYSDERTGIDTIGETGDYYARVEHYFGQRTIRGTALSYAPDGRAFTCCCEPFLRRMFSQLRPHRAVEIGTLYGVTTALLAHYSHEVITIDIAYQQQATYLQCYFGVNKKIKNIIVRNNEDKAECISHLDFDFAFIDADHSYEGVKLDFECVKKCGRVLFHDYGIPNHPGITEFINDLTEGKKWVSTPFAYWEA